MAKIGSEHVTDENQLKAEHVLDRQHGIARTKDLLDGLTSKPSNIVGRS